MIYSAKQYRVSTAQLAELKTSLSSAEGRASSQPWLKHAEIDALKSQIEDIQTEMSEYELLKSGQVVLSKTFSLEDLPRVLIQARIASGMSQTNLAEKLNMKPQQIQRYEASAYKGASLAKLIEIADTLSVKVSGTFEGDRQADGSFFRWRDSADIAWSQLPYQEMIKRRWFKAPQNANPLEIVKEYVIDVVGPQLAATYHRKKMYGGSAPNEYALLAWQARILQRARDMAAHDGVSDFKQDDRWLSELAKLTRLSDGAQRSIRLLAENGIALVIERHLPGSYLDGAAMLDAADRPVIGLTLRYDRLDNFWFVLFHEIGHVFLHLCAGVRFDFFDEERVSPGHSIEADADRFALNTLIPAELWDQCLSRFALSEEAVRIDAATLDIHPSIIAGRIRKELPSTAGLLRLVMIETCPPSASRTSSLERNRKSRTENTSISRTVVPPHRVATKRSTALH